MPDPALIKAAYDALVHYVNDSVDFADAECRICREFNLTDEQLAEVRAMYDQEDVDAPFRRLDAAARKRKACKHEIDFAASGSIVNEGNQWIIDVWCKHCGRSGSFLVDAKTEINW